jgi:hypothetical protein
MTCKPEARKAIEEFRTAITLDERVDRVRTGRKWTARRHQCSLHAAARR